MGRVSEAAPPTLTAQVGGACSIVHVLEWKEGMAILPSSNLKVILLFYTIHLELLLSHIRQVSHLTASNIYTQNSWKCSQTKIISEIESSVNILVII